MTSSRAVRAAVAGGVLALLVVLTAAASVLVERRMESRVDDAVSCRLPEGSTVDHVDVGGSALLALASGEADDVRLDVGAVPVGDTGAVVDLSAELTGIALDDDVALAERVDAARVEVSADAAALEALGASREQTSPVPLELSIADGVLAASATAAGVPVSVGLEPAVVDGALTLEPVSVRFGNRTVDPSVLAGLPGLGSGAGTGGSGPAGGLTGLGADALPDGVTPSEVAVEGDRLALALDVDLGTVAEQLDATSC